LGRAEVCCQREIAAENRQNLKYEKTDPLFYGNPTERGALRMKPKAAVNRLIPKTRSRLRLFCGAKYYTLRRSMRWYFGGVKFARLQSGRRFPCTQFCHATPLYRKLQNADRKLQQNKAVNLRPAIASLDGLVLQPGETFSLLESDRPPVAAQRLPGGNGAFLRNLSSRRGRRLVPAFQFDLLDDPAYGFDRDGAVPPQLRRVSG
jgi:hypothetical protein